MIYNQDDINGVDKLTHLRRALTGPAFEKLKILPITRENYAESWRLLEHAYSNTRIIASRHLNLLLSLPAQDSETPGGLIKLIADIRQHLAALKSLNIQLSEEIIVTILERNIHESTGDKWNNIIKRGIFPKLDDMLEFLTTRASRLINRTNDKPLHIASSRETAKKLYKRTHDQAFLSHAERKCPTCGYEHHPLFRCEKFKCLSPAKRLKITREGKMWFNCLRDNHGVNGCYSRSNCWTYKDCHNTLLHQAIAQDRSQEANQETTRGNQRGA
ncbi:uncharacterized protein LOC105700168 [Orussus abietinus]|uniref:uncharacterized protein LOC105700168 n=1 Tax=Orussus abietinus TaxID=222816 RepID=UPI000626ADB0|nr:uncharacterized protein LOC105700168 [Orussus abietinus]